LHDSRTRRRAFVLGDGHTYTVAGHDAPYWYDSETGQRRKIIEKDVENFTKIADTSENVDMVGAAGMPQDVMPKSSLIHGIEAVYNNTEKPLYFSPDELEVTNAIFDIARIVGGEDDLSKHPTLICQLSSTAPLTWVKGAVESLVETAKCGVPCSILPQPLCGVSAPMTLAGNLAVHNAEVLSGIVITQLVKKGSPIIYAGGWSTFDMKEGTVVFASPESSLLRIAGPNLAKFYKIPCHSLGFDSDALCLDIQNGWEKAITGFIPLLVGVDLMVDLGIFELVLSASSEQLIIDNEILGLLYRVVEGIEVSPETIAFEVIKKVGSRGSFLEEEHTLDHLRTGEHWQPQISSRCVREVWNNRGNPTVVKNARDKVKEIIQTHQPKRLDENKQKEIKRIIETFESQYI